MHQLIEDGPLAAAFGGVRPLIQSGKHGPGNFSMTLLTKDLDLCAAAANGLAMTAAASEAGRVAIATGHGDDDCRALAVHVASA